MSGIPIAIERKAALVRVVVALLATCLLVITSVAGFDPAVGHEYSLTKTWGGTGSADGQLSDPRDIAANSSGYIYVIEAGNGRVSIFTSDGVFITKWGEPGWEDGQFGDPEAIAVDSTGNVYVTDGSRVQKFSSDGTFVTAWGGYGDGDGYFNGPAGIAVGPSGHVYVADTFNDRIQEFTSAGTFIRKWGTSGSGDGQFDWPRGIAVDSSGNVYVADTNNQRVLKFDSAGTFITTWTGSSGPGGTTFFSPRAITVDAAGNIYVACANYIHKMSPAGSLITLFDPVMPFPEGIAVDGDYNVYLPDYWFADQYKDHVLKFAPENRPPVASFTMDATWGQIPATVTFTDTSTNLPTSWLWDFGDGSTSTSQHPVHTYATIGEDTVREYTIRLTATNAIGSTSTTDTITLTLPLEYVKNSPVDGAYITLNPAITISMGLWGAEDEFAISNKILLKKRSTGAVVPYDIQTTHKTLLYTPYGSVIATLLTFERSYANLEPDTWYDLYYDGTVIARYTTGIDTTPPGPITNLRDTARTATSITWGWTDPTDADFYRVRVYLNGVAKGYVPKGVQSYTATGLTPATQYKFAVRTVDTSGNYANPVYDYASTTAVGSAPAALPNDTAAQAIQTLEPYGTEPTEIPTPAVTSTEATTAIFTNEPTVK